MRLFEIFKSEQGFRVAGKLVNGGPVLDKSPWFSTETEAASHAEKMMEEHPAFKKVDGKWDIVVDFPITE